MTNPFDTIVRVIRLPDELIAYDAAGQVVVELTEDGLADLVQRRPDVVVETAASASRVLAVVRCRTTGIVNLMKDTSPATVDGVRLSQDDLVLVTEQINPKNNGIYRVFNADNRNAHTPNTWWVFAGEQPDPQTVIHVTEGLIHGGTFWTMSAGIVARTVPTLPPTA